MEAIKLTQKIHSQTLKIRELEAFQGRTVEVIIIALDRPPDSRSPRETEKKAGGMLSKYKNTALIEQESTAWELAVQEKYAHR